MKLNEWLKALKCHIEPTLEESIQYLGKYFPLLYKYKETTQDPIWHAEGDVHIHTNMVLKELYKIFNDKEFTPSPEERQILILSAILHDIGKPLVTKEVDGRIKASKHEQVGMSQIVHSLLELELDFHAYSTILNIVGYHQKPKLLVIKDEPDSSYFALSRQVDPILIYWLEVADIRGRICDDKEETLMYLEEYLSKTTTILKRISEDNKIVRHDKYISSKASSYLLANNLIQSPLESPQYLYERLQDPFRFIMLCGVAGVGKSWHIYKAYDTLQNKVIISLDDIREELSHRQDMSINNKVVLIAKERIKEALRKKQNIIYDATNLKKEYREALLTLAHNYGAITQIDVLLAKESKIKYQNKNRKYVVPENVIDQMLVSLEYPSINEAYKVNYISV